MNIEKMARSAMKDFDFKLFAYYENGQKAPCDFEEIVALFYQFLSKKERISELEKKAIAEYEKRKNDKEEANKKRPSFSSSLLKWLLLNDMVFRFFCKKTLNINKNKLELAELHYTTSQKELAIEAFENDNQNPHDLNRDC